MKWIYDVRRPQFIMTKIPKTRNAPPEFERETRKRLRKAGIPVSRLNKIKTLTREGKYLLKNKKLRGK